ncbi:MAG: hypothetical protein ABL933_06380 [Methyloglobulus sp.]
MIQTQCETDSVLVSILEHEEGENVNAFELGSFLYYFRAAYVTCLDLIQSENITIEQIESLERTKLVEILGFNKNGNVTDLWLRELSEELDLEFITISKKSPLKFVAKSAGASLIALTMAVILSGGEANVLKGEFKLPPLAHGIRELMDAFDKQPPNALPSERRSHENDSPRMG